MIFIYLQKDIMKLTKEQVKSLAIGLKNNKPKQIKTIKTEYLKIKKATQK